MHNTQAVANCSTNVRYALACRCDPQKLKFLGMAVSGRLSAGRVNDKLKRIGHLLSSFVQLGLMEPIGGKPPFQTAFFELELFHLKLERCHLAPSIFPGVGSAFSPKS